MEKNVKNSKTVRRVKKVKKRRSIFLFIMIALIIAFILSVFYVIDLNRINKGKNTIFCFYHHTYDDGGSTENIGLGYKIFKYNATYGRKDVVGGWIFLKYDPKIDLQLQNLDKEYTTVEGETVNLDQTYKDLLPQEYDIAGTITFTLDENGQKQLYVRSTNKYSNIAAAMILVNDNTKIVKNGQAFAFEQLQKSDRVQIVTEQPLAISKGGGIAKFIKVVTEDKKE